MGIVRALSLGRCSSTAGNWQCPGRDGGGAGGKPGRRWGELRGEYAEVRQLAATLRDVADSHGVTLRALEDRMAYGHSAISLNLSGVKRPEWDFVVSFLRA